MSARAQTDSLSFRLMDFFRENGDEELTYEDVVAKFGCKPNAAYQAVDRLVRQGKLESLRVIRAPIRPIKRIVKETAT